MDLEIQTRLEKVERIIGELVDKIASIANFYYANNKTPETCPLCKGESIKAEVADCYLCNNVGIIWTKTNY